MKKLRLMGVFSLMALATACANHETHKTDQAGSVKAEKAPKLSQIKPLEWDGKQGFATFNAEPNEQQKQVDYVLGNTNQMESAKLFIAANTALSLQRLDDAGFLLYSAMLRTEEDLVKYPPVETGENSPVQYYNFLAANSAPRIDQVLTFNPDNYQRVVKRLEQWNCNVTPEYAPLWKYSEVNVAAPSCEEIKQKRIVPMQRLAKLFNNDQYKAQVNALGAYLQMPEQQQMQEQAIEQRNQVLEQMLNYEREVNTPGIAAALLRAQQQAEPKAE